MTTEPESKQEKLERVNAELLSLLAEAKTCIEKELLPVFEEHCGVKNTEEMIAYNSMPETYNKIVKIIEKHT